MPDIKPATVPAGGSHGYQTRVLPREEWPSLIGTALGEHVELLDGAVTSVVVVQADSGAIVACWAAFPVIHLEGLWVAPEYRKKVTVARHLLRGMMAVLKALHVGSAMTFAADTQTAQLLAHYGAGRIPGAAFMLPVKERF